MMKKRGETCRLVVVLLSSMVVGACSATTSVVPDNVVQSPLEGGVQYQHMADASSGPNPFIYLHHRSY